MEDQGGFFTGQFRGWFRRPTLLVANAFYMFGVIGMVALSSLTLLLAGLFPGLGALGPTYLHAMLVEVGVFALPCLLYARAHPGVGRSMRLNPPEWTMLAVAVVAALVGVLFTNGLGVLWQALVEALGGRLVNSGMPVPATQGELMLSVVFVGFIPGLCEELLFRGTILGAYERRGSVRALAVSSVLFATMHGSVLGLPIHLLLGFVLGYLVIASDSLYTGMVYHAVHNSALMILSYLQNQQIVETAAMVSAEYSVLEQLGGAAGLTYLGLQTLMLGAVYLGVLLLPYFNRVQQGKSILQVPAASGDRRPMGVAELLALSAGVLTVGVLYLIDLLSVCWII